MGNERWDSWMSQDRGDPPRSHAHPDQLSDRARAAALDAAVNELIAVGWRVESRSRTQAVLARGHPPNHVLHAILTVCTCFFWGIVWLVLGLTQKEQRQSLTVDTYGHVLHTVSRR